MEPIDIIKQQQKADRAMEITIGFTYPIDTLIQFKKGKKYIKAVVKYLNNFKTDRLFVEDVVTKETFFVEVNPYAPPEKISGTS